MSLTPDERVRVYEQPPLRQVAGETIRPGGLELTERAWAFCGLPPGARVVDVGCGTGATVEHLIAEHRTSATGLDPSSRLLQEGRQRNGYLPLIRAPGERLPLVDGCVDAVLAECTLSLMANLDQTLAECYRVLRPGGILAISDLYARQPQGAVDLHRLPLSSCLSGALPRQEWLSRVQAQGFEIRLWEDHTDSLKRFAAQLILTHGSLENFWSCMAPKSALTTLSEPALSGQIAQAVAAARPGYFLMVSECVR